MGYITFSIFYRITTICDDEYSHTIHKKRLNIPETKVTDTITIIRT